jgi:tRNA A-37 threonylcarbamoyl transferase component Bud32
VEAVRLLAGRYRLVEHLGAGGMAVVWRAYDDVLGRWVAVKMQAARSTADPLWRRRIRAEAQAVARLAHPNIANVYDYGESTTLSGECVPYLVMELLPGPTLAERLEVGPLPVEVALRTCGQVAAALAAAHARGLVHRDVKPANVILTAAGAKVVDFGIAAIAGVRSESTSDGAWGTPGYVAPERLAGGAVLPACDVYALGLLLYRCLTGTMPWPSTTITEMLAAHQHTEPAPLPPIDNLPTEIASLCHQCLAKKPHERPTMHEVASALANACGPSAVPTWAGDENLDTMVLSGTTEITEPDALPRITPRSGAYQPAHRRPARSAPPPRRRSRYATALAAAVVVALFAMAAVWAHGAVLGRPTGLDAAVTAPTVAESRTPIGHDDSRSYPSSTQPAAEDGGAGGATASTTGGGAQPLAVPIGGRTGSSPRSGREVGAPVTPTSPAGTPIPTDTATPTATPAPSATGTGTGTPSPTDTGIPSPTDTGIPSSSPPAPTPSDSPKPS